ncbi:MAG: NAD(P)-binding domain-containing protein [Ferruginibacter sp.]
MKIGIIGTGIVGRTLASGFLAEGHQTMLGSRNPGKDEVVKWKAENKNGLAGSFEETASFAEVIVLAVKGKISSEALTLAGKDNIGGKVIIDATNPLADAPPTNGMLKLYTDLNHSLMEKLQEEFPDAKFVKAFNSVGAGMMHKPDLNGLQPTMFICGNDAAAKTTVTEILGQFGWETADMGLVDAARIIEPLCILVCIPGFQKNDWTYTLKFVKK